MIPKPAAPFRHPSFLLHRNKIISTTIRRKTKAAATRKTLSQNCQPGDISK